MSQHPSSQKKLFTPLKVGAFTAPNRVFMAPLTRCAVSNPVIFRLR